MKGRVSQNVEECIFSTVTALFTKSQILQLPGFDWYKSCGTKKCLLAVNGSRYYIGNFCPPKLHPWQNSGSAPDLSVGRTLQAEIQFNKSFHEKVNLIQRQNTSFRTLLNILMNISVIIVEISNLLGGCWSPCKYQIKRGYIPCNSSNNNCVMVVKLNSKPSPIPGQGCTIFRTFLTLNPDTEITFKLEV